MTDSHLVHLLFLLGAFNALLLAVLLPLKYKAETAYYLSAVSALFGILLIFYVAYWAKLEIPALLVWVQYLTFLVGPFFYGMASRVAFRDLSKSPFVVHLLPFFLIVLLTYLPGTAVFIFVAQPLHLAIYAWLVHRTTATSTRPVRRWIVLPLVGYAGLFSLYTIMVATQTLTVTFDYLISLGSCLFIFSILIKSYLQPPFIHRLNNGNELSPTAIEAILTRVSDHLEKARPYLNGEYRLGDLSQALQIKPYQLSEAINTKYHGFVHLLNGYRVAEAITLLSGTDQKVVDIAYMSGFNNKVSFYKSFKKATGKTPVEWRRALQKEVNISLD